MYLRWAQQQQGDISCDTPYFVLQPKGCQVPATDILFRNCVTLLYVLCFSFSTSVTGPYTACKLTILCYLLPRSLLSRAVQQNLLLLKGHLTVSKPSVGHTQMFKRKSSIFSDKYYFMPVDQVTELLFVMDRWKLISQFVII